MKTKIKFFTLMVFAVLMLGSCSKKDPDILVKHKVEFSPTMNLNLKPNLSSYYVIAKIDDEEIKSGIEVEEGKEIVFTAYVGPTSKKLFKKWEVTGADIPDDKAKTITIKVKGPLKVTGIFESFTIPLK